MEKLEFRLDEVNELLFKVVIEGTKERPSAIRFVCENGEDVSYMFKGKTGIEPGEILITIPAMEKVMKEGEYEGRLEVLIEGKYLSPLRVLTRFSPGVKVVAEAVESSVAKPEITARASVVMKQEKKSLDNIVVQKSDAPVISLVTLAEKYDRRSNKK